MPHISEIGNVSDPAHGRSSHRSPGRTQVPQLQLQHVPGAASAHAAERAHRSRELTAIPLRTADTGRRANRATRVAALLPRWAPSGPTGNRLDVRAGISDGRRCDCGLYGSGVGRPGRASFPNGSLRTCVRGAHRWAKCTRIGVRHRRCGSNGRCRRRTRHPASWSRGRRIRTGARARESRAPRVAIVSERRPLAGGVSGPADHQNEQHEGHYPAEVVAPRKPRRRRSRHGFTAMQGPVRRFRARMSQHLGGAARSIATSSERTGDPNGRARSTVRRAREEPLR